MSLSLVGVNKDKIQEKLIAIGNASTTNNTSKAVLSNATVRSIGVENNTLNITEANNVINLAVNTNNIQEKLNVGTLSVNDNSAPILVSKKVKGLKGQRGITVTGDDEQVILQGPPCADWTSGLASEPYYIDTGPTKLAIRNATSQTVVEFAASTSKDIRAYGSLTTEGGLTVKGNASFFDAVEIVKSATDATSGTVQVPTVITK